MLLASAMDNWEDGGLWLSRAESCYNVTLANATMRQDTESLKMLKELRAELDELKEFRKEDMEEMAREAMDGFRLRGCGHG